MNAWWVNHKQTFRLEFRGGYLWSPKVRLDGHRNPYYEFMRALAPGDLVFSYADGALQGIGVAQTHCYTCPRPDEFGKVGEVWDAVGWRVNVRFEPFRRPVRPRDHWQLLGPMMPEIHSPLLPNGMGKQGVYLTSLTPDLARVLAGLGGPEFAMQLDAPAVLREAAPIFELDLPGLAEWEAMEERRIEQDDGIPATERSALIKARVGQGRFKENVAAIERACRVTRVINPTHLIASHIKPWRDSSNDERLEGTNGLLLTPSIDHLFDRGFISFEDSGELLVSPIADRDSLSRMGVPTDRVVNVGRFNVDQRHFLQFHHKNVFLKADVN